MDRTIVYAGGIGQDTDVLKLNRDVMIGLGKLAAAVLGTTTLAYNLAATPGSGLTVAIGAGQLFSLQNVDNNAYGSLAADTAHSIVKQGIQLDPVTLTLAAPTTSGQSIAYLIEATYQDSDTDNTVLPFYNSANPSQPFSGQNNNGQSLPTRRAGTIALQAKAGTAAATGSQVAPVVDNGYVPLYVVTVNYGDTSIAQAAIKTHWAAPFISSGGLLAAIQTQAATTGSDTGAANAYAVNITPAPTAYVLGQYVVFKAGNANTGAATLNLNGLGTKSIVRRNGAALQAGDVAAGAICELVYDGTNFQLLNSAMNNPVFTGTVTADAVNAPTGSFLRKNAIINGNFDIWQRGTSYSPTGAVSGCMSDRWYGNLAAAGTWSQQAFTLGQGVVPFEPAYFFRWNQTAAFATQSTIEQRIESVRTLAGGQTAVSFWAKADAVRSITASLIQNFGTGGTPSASVTTTLGTFNLTTSWQKFTAIVSLPNLSGKTIGTNGGDYLALQFQLPANVTYTFDLAQVQVEKGSVATDFEVQHIADELKLCQRYYETGYYSIVFQAAASAQYARAMVGYRVTKRATATIALTSTYTASTSAAAQTGPNNVDAFGVQTQSTGASAGAESTGTWTANAEL